MKALKMQAEASMVQVVQVFVEKVKAHKHLFVKF